MRVLRLAVIGSIVSGACVLTGGGQSRQNPPPVMGPPPMTGANMPSIGGRNDPMNDPLNGRMEEQQAKSRNSDRQKRLVSDADKLVILTKELKDQIEAPGKSSEPGDLGRKAEEIEKLAKSVKDRMKG